MSKSRRLQLLAALLAAILCLTLCAFTAFADADEKGEDPVEASDAEPVLTTGADDTEPVATTGAETSEPAADNPEAGTESSDAAATGTESQEAESTGTKEAGEDSASEAETAQSGEESGGETSSESNVPWKLIIAVGVIVLLAAVVFILSKTKTKLGEKIAKFFKDYKSELKKIVWMPWKDLVKATGIVLVVLLAAALLTGLLDYGFSSLVRLLSKIGS